MVEEQVVELCSSKRRMRSVMISRYQQSAKARFIYLPKLDANEYYADVPFPSYVVIG